MPIKCFPACLFVVVLAAVAVSIESDPAHAYRLPDTGQSQCYDDTGGVLNPCPSPGQRFYGQDGNYAGPQPTYQDNGDYTVTDLNTGLMWQQGDEQNNIYRTWQEAVDYCAGLNLGGKTDWRLPTRLELLSIVDYSGTYPAVNTAYFPDCRSSYYWSGTTAADLPYYAWFVSFYLGDGIWHYKDLSYYVRCVRGGP